MRRRLVILIENQALKSFNLAVTPGKTLDICEFRAIFDVTSREVIQNREDYL